MRFSWKFIPFIKLFEELNGKVSSGSAANLGAIELKSGTPLIDFHFDNSDNDYTSRIIEYAEGQLGLKADLFNVQALLRMNGQNVATESYVDNKVQTITATANSDWISWGDLKGFIIMGRFFLTCSEFQFAKSEPFGNGDNALLWTLNTDTGIYGRVFYVHTSSRMVRLRIDGNTVRGHYDTPPTGDVFTVNEFFG